MTKIFESKTNGLLVLFAVLALIVVLVGAIAFNEKLWNEFFDLIKVEVGGGVLRAATNDGIPKAVEAYAQYKNGHSQFSQPMEVRSDTISHGA